MSRSIRYMIASGESIDVSSLKADEKFFLAITAKKVRLLRAGSLSIETFLEETGNVIDETFINEKATGPQVVCGDLIMKVTFDERWWNEALFPYLEILLAKLGVNLDRYHPERPRLVYTLESALDIIDEATSPTN